MTQFKFGDRVRHPKYGECMVVTQWYDADTDDPTWVSIISEEHGECDTRHEELELVPHPDTVRLDFIQRKLHEIRLIECSETGAVAFCLTKKSGWIHTDTLRPTIRESIDNTMQQEQKT